MIKKNSNLLLISLIFILFYHYFDSSYSVNISNEQIIDNSTKNKVNLYSNKESSNSSSQSVSKESKE